MMSFVDELKYDANGLVTVVIQDAGTNEVLTLAYMNREAVQRTFETGKTWFWRRSHQKLMMKGETSGNVQIVKEILVDCDQDALVVKVEQTGKAACHEGYVSCFFRKVSADGSVEVVGERVFNPADVYGQTG
jgi:phosphoribosyl-AMP cyclohydrolase